MIKEEHLFPNRSWFESRGKDVPNTIAGLLDNQLLIKLSGIKELARLRGFTRVRYITEKCDKDHVAVTCEINFIPNFETANQEVIFQDMANATLQNTSSFATKFLETIACNRAFVRCVRNFLNVHIVGDDEIDKSSGHTKNVEVAYASSLTPNGILEKSFNDFLSFQDALRNLWRSKTYRNEEASKWDGFESIPPKEARVLIKLLK
tara:strand:- start:83 stop:700 length:618 start_codon:yes stop_codon:yes gene_type:complete